MSLRVWRGRRLICEVPMFCVNNEIRFLPKAKISHQSLTAPCSNWGRWKTLTWWIKLACYATTWRPLGLWAGSLLATWLLHAGSRCWHELVIAITKGANHHVSKDQLYLRRVSADVHGRGTAEPSLRSLSVFVFMFSFRSGTTNTQNSVLIMS